MSSTRATVAVEGVVVVDWKASAFEAITTSLELILNSTGSLRPGASIGAFDSTEAALDLLEEELITASFVRIFRVSPATDLTSTTCLGAPTSELGFTESAGGASEGRPSALSVFSRRSLVIEVPGTASFASLFAATPSDFEDVEVGTLKISFGPVREAGVLATAGRFAAGIGGVPAGTFKELVAAAVDSKGPVVLFSAASNPDLKE
jgi:hypothetical protein